MIFVDPGLEPGKLAEKGATFSARQVIMAQSLVEPLISSTSLTRRRRL